MTKRSRVVTRLHSREVAVTAQLVDWTQVDAAIVVSEQMKQRLLAVSNVRFSQLRVVNYGFDLKRFRLAQRQFQHRIGMIARVVPVKRVYEAVLTLHELRCQGYSFTLRVGGPLGDELEPRYPWAIRELIARLGLGEHVTLCGPIVDPAPFYAETDIFLSNSFWEGQQNALLEAMASGCYCLSHCWGGAEEVLPQENIFTTESELQAKLLAYAALPPDAQAAAQAQMRVIAEERFDERRMVNEIVGVVDAVLCLDQQG